MRNSHNRLFTLAILLFALLLMNGCNANTLTSELNVYEIEDFYTSSIVWSPVDNRLLTVGYYSYDKKWHDNGLFLIDLSAKESTPRELVESGVGMMTAGWSKDAESFSYQKQLHVRDDIYQMHLVKSKFNNPEKWERLVYSEEDNDNETWCNDGSLIYVSRTRPIEKSSIPSH